MSEIEMFSIVMTLLVGLFAVGVVIGILIGKGMEKISYQEARKQMYESKPSTPPGTDEFNDGVNVGIDRCMSILNALKRK